MIVAAFLLVTRGTGTFDAVAQGLLSLTALSINVSVAARNSSSIVGMRAT
jgi:hypothetical protein